jgi:hypothetical protein
LFTRLIFMFKKKGNEEKRRFFTSIDSEDIYCKIIRWYNTTVKSYDGIIRRFTRTTVKYDGKIRRYDTTVRYYGMIRR